MGTKYAPIMVKSNYAILIKEASKKSFFVSTFITFCDDAFDVSVVIFSFFF
ncbi:hypothetical protein D3C73_1495270 [compost metagenome]